MSELYALHELSWVAQVSVWRNPKSEQNRIQTVCSEMSHSAPQGEKEDSKEGSIGDDKSEKESRDKSDKDDKKKKKKVET